MKEKILNFFEALGNKKCKVIGAIIGFIIGILILIIGFLKTIFIVICTLVGYYIGSRVDYMDNFNEIINKVIHQNKDN